MKAQHGTPHTWRRGLLVLCAPVTAIILAFAVAMPAMAATTTNIDIPLNGTVVNPCNGEIVTFTGVDHFTAQVTVNSGGGFHLATHDNIHVTATGDLGNTYVGNQEDYSDLNATAAVESTSTLSFSEISQGSAPNFLESAVVHITFTPSGVATAFVDNFTASCRG